MDILRLGDQQEDPVIDDVKEQVRDFIAKGLTAEERLEKAEAELSRAIKRRDDHYLAKRQVGGGCPGGRRAA